MCGIFCRSGEKKSQILSIGCKKLLEIHQLPVKKIIKFVKYLWLMNQSWKKLHILLIVHWKDILGCISLSQGKKKLIIIYVYQRKKSWNNLCFPSPPYFVNKVSFFFQNYPFPCLCLFFNTSNKAKLILPQ